MKYITYEYNNKQAYGVLVKEEKMVLPLQEAAQNKGVPLPEDLVDAIGHEKWSDTFIQELISDESESAQLIALEDIQLKAPIPRPKKNVFCVGKNYAEHAIEMGSAADIPKEMIVFTKSPTTVAAPDEEIPHYQQLTEMLDYEGEVGVIIGKKGKEIEEAEALDYVFGYTIINDITARDIQSKHKQYFLGKSLDQSCPIGPWIVGKEELTNPNDLRITTKVNGEVRQDSHTSKFIFPIEKIIHILSKGMTLEPGDIIATGTPAGVGNGFKPPRFLKPGDHIEITVEGVGQLSNTIMSIN